MTSDVNRHKANGATGPEARPSTCPGHVGQNGKPELVALRLSSSHFSAEQDKEGRHDGRPAQGYHEGFAEVVVELEHGRLHAGVGGEEW